MLPTLENALNQISKLENRIARLEKMLMGNGEPPSVPESPVLLNQPFNNSELAFPQLSTELMEEDEAKMPMGVSVKPAQPGIIHTTSALETIFPNIAENITLVWGNPECEAYLNKLMINSRGDRQGFDLNIMAELMLLTEITEFKQADVWTEAIKIGEHR